MVVLLTRCPSSLCSPPLAAAELATRLLLDVDICFCSELAWDIQGQSLERSRYFLLPHLVKCVSVGVCETETGARFVEIVVLEWWNM